MFYEVKDKLGFKFYELKNLSKEKYKVEYFIPEKISIVKKSKHLPVSITGTIKISLEDVNLQDEIENFLRHQLKQSNIDFEYEKSFTHYFNNKGKASVGKMERYNNEVKNFVKKLKEEDTEEIFKEMISFLRAKVELYNEKEKEQMIEHLSKFDSYEFKSKEVEEASEKIRELEEKLKEAKIALNRARLEDAKKDLNNCDMLDEEEKNKISYNLEKKVENFSRGRFIRR